MLKIQSHAAIPDFAIEVGFIRLRSCVVSEVGQATTSDAHPGYRRRIVARMKRSGIRVRELGCAAIITLVVVVGFAASARAQGSKVWRHGIINLKSDAGFVMMPMQHDFASKRGLKIEIVQIRDGALELKALLSGEVDSIDGGAGEGIIAAMRGTDVKIVGCHWPGLPHALFVRGDIDSIGDLKDKTIASSAPGSLPDNIVRTLLEKYGIPLSEVTLTAIGSDADRYRALLANIVDATIVSSEYLPLSPPGIKILVSAREVMPNYMRLCLNITGKNLAARPDDAVKFLAAQIEGLRYAVTHRDETIKLARDLSEAKPDDPRPAFVYDEFVKYKAVDPEIAIPMDKLAWMQEQFVKNGSLPQPGDIAKIVDPAPRAKALEMVGK
jgi:NitT/TauT family transport system substrate-binding protein